ncbi:MAG: ATP-dependent zinc protease [Planctomycetaceae bacterium]|nr:ATP-dependent zinc protease [Planctomycetaceae bacterium]
MRPKKPKPPKPVIGWREWIALPDLGIDRIKVKVDTGARSSSLHAYDLQYFERRGTRYVRFKVHPLQRKTHEIVTTEAEVIDVRSVRSSSGKASKRPVILTNIILLEQTWPIELTLANRDEMGFRMLLGREAFRGRSLVDAGKSYYSGGNRRTKKEKKR